MRPLGLAVLVSLAACGNSGVIRESLASAAAAAGSLGASDGSSCGLGSTGVAGSVGISGGSCGSVSSTGVTVSGSGTTSGGKGATSGHTASTGQTATSGSTASTTTTTSGTSGAFTIASHAPFPQIPNNGGGVIAAPELVTVTFPGESYDLSGFADWLVQSDWLLAVGKDYGVGAGTHPANLVSTTPVGSTLDDSAIQAFLSDNAGGTLPAPTANTIYVLAFPSGTSVTNNNIGTSCQSFLGYHSTFSASAGTFVYAVIPTCSAGESAMAAFSYSVIASHEILEAATDPGGGSWALNGGVWTVLGTEVGDLCQGKYFQSDAGYLVQRLWSNTAAALGNTSPCIPFPAEETYFNVTAEAVAGGTGDFSADVPSSSQAQAVAFTLTPWSTAPDGFGLNLAQISGPKVSVNIKTSNGQPPTLENGVPLTMTITVPAGTTSTDIGIALLSSDDTFATQNVAPLLIHVD